MATHSVRARVLRQGMFWSPSCPNSAVWDAASLGGNTLFVISETDLQGKGGQIGGTWTKMDKVRHLTVEPLRFWMPFLPGRFNGPHKRGRRKTHQKLLNVTLERSPNASVRKFESSTPSRRRALGDALRIFLVSDLVGLRD